MSGRRLAKPFLEVVKTDGLDRIDRTARFQFGVDGKQVSRILAGVALSRRTVAGEVHERTVIVRDVTAPRNLERMCSPMFSRVASLPVRSTTFPRSPLN